MNIPLLHASACIDPWVHQGIKALMNIPGAILHGSALHCSHTMA